MVSHRSRDFHGNAMGGSQHNAVQSAIRFYAYACQLTSCVWLLCTIYMHTIMRHACVIHVWKSVHLNEVSKVTCTFPLGLLYTSQVTAVHNTKITTSVKWGYVDSVEMESWFKWDSALFKKHKRQHLVALKLGDCWDSGYRVNLNPVKEEGYSE